MIFVICMLFSTCVFAQTTIGKPAALTRIEPGLENAVKWKWRVVPSDEKHWGLEMPTPTPSPPPAVTPTPPPEIRPTFYEVKHGDALILIARKFGMTVAQLKTFNGLQTDKIRVNQKLKIPTLAELSAIAPPVKKQKPAKTAESVTGSEPDAGLGHLSLQIFLDREQFSAGPIAREPGPAFARILLLYQSTHEDARDDISLGAKARAAVGNVFTRYKLKAEDFRFITQPKAETIVAPKQTPLSAHAHPGKLPSKPAAIGERHPTYEELTAMPMLPYRTPWEFVAERFHCRETYLHTLNPKLSATPGAGSEFQVPNVIPFEIEKAFDEPLQPQADSNNPVRAAVVGLSQLNIYQGDALIAVFPVSPARPGLHGRGTWTILDAIPRPRLATLQEESTEQTRKPGPTSTIPEPTPSPTRAVLSSEQYLAAGPRNPVGIVWINLTKAKSTEPLPYGLHGTSIPDQMNVEQSIGGFRLANWDIARAVHRLPVGTPLEWK
ncbi:MAG TPA: LysM peptidoglycan-binding domain-containing protein [Chthoniobacterales bacterium]|nr:LysM peptidoglycan-binding domain-containing protein [Chthoniobacterales bacterium]